MHALVHFWTRPWIPPAAALNKGLEGRMRRNTNVFIDILASYIIQELQTIISAFPAYYNIPHAHSVSEIYTPSRCRRKGKHRHRQCAAQRDGQRRQVFDLNGADGRKRTSSSLLSDKTSYIFVYASTYGYELVL